MILRKTVLAAGALAALLVSASVGSAKPTATAKAGATAPAQCSTKLLTLRPHYPDPVKPLAGASSTLSGAGSTFVAPINEWYSWTPSPRANPDVKVLLTLDGSNFPLGVKNTLNGGDIPVAWINTKYRMVYVNYGHGDRIYSAPPLPTMIDNILRWLLSR